MELHEKVAVVTGGGSGLGRHLVAGLGAAGCRVLVADVDAGAVEETAALVPGAEAHVVDVRDDAAMAALVARAAELGGPHVVVNNAGGWSPGSQFPEASPEVWSATLDLDLRAPMLLTQLALPAMVAAGGGVVVGIGSSAGVGFAGYGSPEYAAAKAGLVRFTTSVAGLEETHGVRVTAVVPDWVGLDRAVAEVASMAEEERPVLVPPEDVVAAVLDLARTGRGGAVVELWGGRPPLLRDGSRVGPAEPLTRCRRQGVPWSCSNRCSNNLPAEATSTPASAGIGPLTQRAHSSTGDTDRCRSGVGQDGVEVWSLNASRPCRGKQGEMRRYDDPVEVRKGMVGSREAPEQFLWRGRLWKVRDVLAHWVETGPWWQSSGARAVVGDDAFAEEEPVATHDLLTEREMWRVEAGTGMTNAGVFDLSFSWSDGRWQLVGCAD